MTEAHTALQNALEQGEPLTLSLATLRPRTLLEWLAESDGAARMTVEDGEGQIVVEVGNGLVVGATAETTEGTVTGQPAYERLRHVRTGSAYVEPLRFPSLANILVPVTELPEFHSIPPVASSAGPDTVVIPLPAARPVHVPDPTMEIELPPEIAAPAIQTPETSEAAEDRWDADEPTVEAAMEVLSELEAEAAQNPADEPATEETPVPQPVAVEPEVAAPVAVEPQVATVESEIAAPVAEPSSAGSPRRARGIWAAAAVLLLSLVGGGAALYASPSDTPTPTAEAEAPQEDPEADMSFDLGDLPDDDDTTGDADTRNEARALARRARRQLREGQSADALTNARRAASLRRHLPYYQVLLGDALRANGQRRAARRAYRRALRMRPDYGPAQQRLGRSATLASRLAASDHG